MGEYILTFKEMEDYKIFRKCIMDYLQKLLPCEHTLMEIALSEAVNNAFKYGGNGTVEVKVKVLNGKRLIIRVKDQGKGFDVRQMVENVKRTDFMELNLMGESGRGLMIMNHLVDEMAYNEKGNEVLLAKKLTDKGKGLTDDSVQY